MNPLDTYLHELQTIRSTGLAVQEMPCREAVTSIWPDGAAPLPVTEPDAVH